MRISDWSSDVCSSDLRLLLLPCTILCGARADLTVRTSACASQQVPVFAEMDRNSPSADFLRSVQTFLPRKPSAIVLISAHWEEEDVTVQVQSDGTSLIYRSEEHTSELQSIMRISTAVFCFK